MTEIDAVSSWRQAAADDWGVATQLFVFGSFDFGKDSKGPLSTFEA